MRLTAGVSDYADRLSRLNTKAGQLMRAYLERYGARGHLRAARPTPAHWWTNTARAQSWPARCTTPWPRPRG